MTYCIGMLSEPGLVMLADTRTHAGVDNISTFRKLHVWETPGERVLGLTTAGNLAISQSVRGLLREGLRFAPEDLAVMGPDAPAEPDTPFTLATVPTVFQAALLVGRAIRNVYHTDGPSLGAQDNGFQVSMLLGGQIRGRPLRLFQLYAAGNFVEATRDTPYFQIGELKYGKPILDRLMHPGIRLEEAVKLGLLSVDSTLKSNLSVGMPLDLLVYRRDDFRSTLQRRIHEDDAYYHRMHDAWSRHLAEAYAGLPDPDWWEARPDTADGPA